MHEIKLPLTHEPNQVTAVNSHHGNKVSAQEATKQGHVTKRHCPYDLSNLWLCSEMVSLHAIFSYFCEKFSKRDIKDEDRDAFEA